MPQGSPTVYPGTVPGCRSGRVVVVVVEGDADVVVVGGAVLVVVDGGADTVMWRVDRRSSNRMNPAAPSTPKVSSETSTGIHGARRLRCCATIQRYPDLDEPGVTGESAQPSRGDSPASA